MNTMGEVLTRLEKFKSKTELNTRYIVIYDFKADSDSEITLGISISIGWESIFSSQKMFNACDKPTNIKGANTLLCEAETALKKALAITTTQD